MNGNTANAITDLELIPAPLHGTLARSARDKRYRKTPNGRVQSKRNDDRKYLTRPFVAWDGEGINDPDGSHRYVMLGSSHASTITAHKLSTEQIFEHVLTVAEELPKAIHCVYGAGYDFNMWLQDVPWPSVVELWKKGSVKWGKYRLRWRPGKMFGITHYGKTKRSVTVYDVLPFFQRMFDTACVEYLGEQYPDRELIVRNKARRSEFTDADLAEMDVYNAAELRNLVSLMVEFRARLDRVGLRPSRWDGPGAIASALLKQKGIARALERSGKAFPDAVKIAARTAYAGGRFEVFRCGTVERPAYEYDINSAYPHALRRVPCLAHGQWVRYAGSESNARGFTLHHVSYRGPQSYEPGPLFRRLANGAICYPGDVDGWYWGPELAAAERYLARRYPRNRYRLDIHETWKWESDPKACVNAGCPGPYPFAWITDYYEQRRILKAADDGAHVGIKLALNSLYGKLAQQLGWWLCAGYGHYTEAGQKCTDRSHAECSLHIPPYHQLEWAGYVTASTRALILDALSLVPDAVIAAETDAIFSSVPLDNIPNGLDIGPDLGQWELTEFRDLTYVQSGFWYGTKTDGKQIAKSRGFDRGSVTREHVVRAMAAATAEGRKVTASLSRFVGAGLAAQLNDPTRWTRWETTPRVLSVLPDAIGSKRCHLPCPECGPDGYTLGRWHRTLCTVTGTPAGAGTQSVQFPVEWVNPDPTMEMEDYRRETDETDDDYE